MKRASKGKTILEQVERRARKRIGPSAFACAVGARKPLTPAEEEENKRWRDDPAYRRQVRLNEYTDEELRHELEKRNYRVADLSVSRRGPQVGIGRNAEIAAAFDFLRSSGAKSGIAKGLVADRFNLSPKSVEEILTTQRATRKKPRR